MLFAIGMFFVYVYADANQEVIDKRAEIEKIEEDIDKQEDIIETLESEEERWRGIYEDKQELLEQKNKEVKEAKNNYDVAQQTVQTQEDIDEVERLKKILDDLTKQQVTAENNFNTAKKDLDSWNDRLREAKNKLNILIRTLPDAKESLDDLIVIANRDIPDRLFGNQKGIKISIILSDGCLVSLTCPNYKELADVYDNSDRFISGDFELVDSGKVRSVYEEIPCEGNCSVESTLQKVGEEPIMIWKRQKPLFAENTVEWYEYNLIPVLSFVDPDDQTRIKSKQILIEPNLPTGFDRGMSLAYNQTLSFGQDRKIYGCSDAVMGWNTVSGISGDELLADTWEYFYNNCSTPVNFLKETTYEKYYEPSHFTDCHLYCEYAKWITKAKELAKDYFLAWIPPNITDFGNITNSTDRQYEAVTQYEFPDLNVTDRELNIKDAQQ